MLENIAMWGGIAGCALALVAIIVMILVKQSVNNLLYRDSILFGENYNIKKDAICSALNLVDAISAKGNAVKNTVEFNQQAKKCFNDLLCVISDMRIAEEFYNIALEETTEFNLARIAQFKLMLRDDLGLKIKYAKIVNRAIEKQNTPIQQTTQQTKPVSPVQSVVQQPQTTPAMRPVQQVAPATKPVQPTQVVRRVVKPKTDK